MACLSAIVVLHYGYGWEKPSSTEHDLPTRHPKPSAKNEKGEAHKKSKFQFEEGDPALENFTRTMKALFRVPKSKVHDSAPKSTIRQHIRKAES